MNKNIESEEIKKNLEKCTNNIQEQLNVLDGRFVIIHEQLHDVENKLIGNIIENSKDLLKNINKNNELQPLDTIELKQNVHWLILNCEIACTYEKLRALEAKTNYLHDILKEQKTEQLEDTLLDQY